MTIEFLENQPLRNPKQLGTALRRARKHNNLTQTELAARAGLRQASISDLERGAAGVRLATVFQVLAALGLELVMQDRESD